MGRGSKYNQNTLYEILKIQLKKKKINEETKKNGQAESLSSSTHAGGLIGQRHPSPQNTLLCQQNECSQKRGKCEIKEKRRK